MPATRLICTNLSQINNQEKTQWYWTSMNSEITFRAHCLHIPNVPTCFALWARAAEFVSYSTKDIKSVLQSQKRESLLRNWENPACLQLNQPRGNEVEIGIIVQQELNTSVHDMTSLSQLWWVLVSQTQQGSWRGRELEELRIRKHNP